MTTIYTFALSQGGVVLPGKVTVSMYDGIGIYFLGLGDRESKECLLRTATALCSLGYKLPEKKIIIEFSVPDGAEHITQYDLPLAIGILNEIGIIKNSCLDEFVMSGELGLDGSLRPVCHGYVESFEMAAITNQKMLILPLSDYGDGAIEQKQVPGGVPIVVDSLEECITLLNCF